MLGGEGSQDVTAPRSRDWAAQKPATGELSQIAHDAAAFEGFYREHVTLVMRFVARKPAMLTGPAAVFEALINLVTELPAPPQVRAAAFRALATLPIVIRAVTVDGHPGLRMSISRFSWVRSATLVVDQATSQVQTVIDAEGHSLSISTDWVNRVP
jgi:hypothetical protein